MNRSLVLLALFAIVVYGLGSSLLPLILAAVSALLCEPYIDWLKTKGIKKPAATLLIILSVFLPILLLNAILIPQILRELKEFASVLPDNISKFFDILESWAVAIGVSLDYSRAEVISLVKTHGAELSDNILKILTDALKRSAGNMTQVILAVLNVLLIPVFFFFLVSEENYWRKSLKALIPAHHHDRVAATLERSIAILKSYLRGQVLACAILALFYGVGLKIVGLKFGALIGIMTGSLSFMPYVGFSLGMATGMVVALAMGQGLGFVLAVFAVFMLGQALESFVVTPKLVGNSVGLTALEAMLVLIVFGNLFGFAGMLVAIPTGAVIKTVLTEYATA